MVPMDVAHNDGWRGGLEDVGLKFYVERHGTEDADAGFDDELELIFIEHSGLLKFFDDGLHIHLQQFPGWDSCSLQFRSLTFILHFRKYNKLNPINLELNAFSKSPRPTRALSS